MAGKEVFNWGCPDPLFGQNKPKSVRTDIVSPTARPPNLDNTGVSTLFCPNFPTNQHMTSHSSRFATASTLAKSPQSNYMAKN